MSFDGEPGPASTPRPTPQSAALVLRARGAPFKWIAAELGVSHSVAAHLVRRGMAELSVRTQAELIAALKGPDAPAVPSLPAGLTAAERDVALRALTGFSNGDIARARGTSPRTVANQLRAIYRKLRVGSRWELAARLLELIDSDPGRACRDPGRALCPPARCEAP